MGEIGFAAKCMHASTLLMSEHDSPVKGKRQAAIDGLDQTARRAKAVGADTVVICDTHRVINADDHINANDRFLGLFTSNGFPEFVLDMPCDHEGDPALGDATAKAAPEGGANTLPHHVDSHEMEHGTLVPMRFLTREDRMKLVSVAVWCTVDSRDERRVICQAICKEVEASDRKVVLDASGSLSQRIRAAEDCAVHTGTVTIRPEFNRRMDLHVLDMPERGDHAAFLKTLPEHAQFCCSESSLHDKGMFCGVRKCDANQGKCEVVTPRFPSFGTGQANVIFPVS